jgi:hypothetical protein
MASTEQWCCEARKLLDVFNSKTLVCGGLPSSQPLQLSSPPAPADPRRMASTILGCRRFSRKPKLTKHQAREVLKRVAAGEPMREIEPSYNVDRSTIFRLKAPYAAEV